MSLTEETCEELEFWQQNVQHLNGRPIRMSAGATRIAFSDASNSGYGGYVVELGPHFTNGLWSDEEAKLSSTWRELKAVYLVLKGFSAQLEGHTVKWYTDNQNVVRIVEAGSRKPHLQDGAISIFEECFQHGIKLEMAWIPRCENEKADYLSRIVDCDDWQIDPNILIVIGGNTR